MSTASTRAGWIVGWLGRVAFTGGAQAAVQLVGFVAGIVVIRALTHVEYAYYTLASAVFGTMCVLADSGIATGVMTQGGRVWQDRTRLGGTIVAALALRRRLAIASALVALPVLAVLLRQHGASWPATLLTTASIVPLYVATVRGHVLEAVPRLHQALAPLQAIQFATNAVRLVLMLILMPFAPQAAVAWFAIAPSQRWANARLARLAGTHADLAAAPDPQARALIVQQVRRTLPVSIYFTVSSQISVWLIALFGSASSVAAVGALGRLAMLFSVLGSAHTLLVVPRFARIAVDRPGLVRARYWQSQALLLAMCAAPLAALYAYPAAALALLGPSYAGLGHEVLLMAVSSVLALLSGAAAVGSARGHVVPPGLVIAYSLAWQAAFVWLVPTDTVAGVIWIAILTAAVQWALQAAWFTWATRVRG